MGGGRTLQSGFICTPSILQPRVRIPSTKSVFFPLLILYCESPELSGFVCAFQSAAPGSDPEYTIYALFFTVYLTLN